MTVSEPHRLPEYYFLEAEFANDILLQIVARSEIISSLYELAHREMHHQFHGSVQKLGAPQVYPYDLISRDRKLMILGSGRSGTSFLVKLLTRLGFYTGYMPYNETTFGTTRGGCEFGVFSFGEINALVGDCVEAVSDDHIRRVQEEFAHGPFVVKSPAYSWFTKMFAFYYEIPLGHILLPIRDHREVAKSRIAEGIPLRIIGETYDAQIVACDVMVGRVVETAVLADIPLTLMRFPDLVKDESYCWDKLDSVLSGTFDIHLDRDRFHEEFEKLADPSMIQHSFNKSV